MYFSNIINNEIQHFHNKNGADFSMSLADMLNHDLFKVELISNNIYRIYPLFYCNKIISSNPNDVILDNRCLIVKKNEKETYFSFLTNYENNILLNDEYNIKQISDNLTMNEFNSFIYRLRQQSTLKGDLNFEDETEIIGVYGTYQFNNINEQLRNDAGLIINNRIKNNPLTVKLINPFFINARYTLTFTVKSITGANVCESGNEDFVSEVSFDLDLIKDVEVTVPLDDYVNDSVLDFDVSVNVSFDVPEIVNGDFELDLSVNKNDIIANDEIILTATLEGENNINGYLVSFYDDGVLIGNIATDIEGVASLSYVVENGGNHVFSASVLGLNTNINIFVEKLNTNLTGNVINNNIIYGDEVVLDGRLLVDNEPINNLPVKLYDNNILITTLRTNSNGNITYTTNQLTAGNHTLTLEYEETKKHKNSTLNINIIIKTLTRITIQSSTTPPIYAGETIYTTTGILYDDLNNTPLPNKTIKIKINNNNWQTQTTNENGEFTSHGIISYGYKTLTYLFEGDNYYDTSNTSQNIFVKKHDSDFNNVIINPYSVSGYLVQAETGTPIKNATVELVFNNNYTTQATTNNEGYFAITLMLNNNYYSPSIWNMLSYDGDEYNNSKTLTISSYPIEKYTTFIEDKGRTYENGMFKYKGVLMTNAGTPVTKKKVTCVGNYLYNHTVTTTTDSNGYFYYTSNYDEGVECTFSGDSIYSSCEGLLR